MKVHSLYQLVLKLHRGNLYYVYDGTIIEIKLHKSTILRKNLNTGNTCSIFNPEGYVDILIDDKIELSYSKPN